MNLYTPSEVAEKLKLFNAGKPNSRAVRKLCKTGKLEYMEITKKNIRISDSAIEDYKRRVTCRAKTKESTLPTEKTEVGGVSPNTETDKNIGMLAASQAEKKLKQSLQSCSLEKQKTNILQLVK